MKSFKTYTSIPINVDKLGLYLGNLEIKVFISMINIRETRYQRDQ